MNDSNANVAAGELEGELRKFVTTYKSSFSANIRVSLISLPDNFSPATKILCLKLLTVQISLAKKLYTIVGTYSAMN